VTAALDIVARVVAGELPREAGVAMLEIMFNLSSEQAEAMMGTVGNGFEPNKPDKPAVPPQAQEPPPPPPPPADDGKGVEPGCGCGDPNHGHGKAADPEGWKLPPKGEPIRKEYVGMVARYRAAAVKHYGLASKAKDAEQAINISATPLDLSEFLESDVRRMRPHVELYVDAAGKRTMSRLGITDDESLWDVGLPEVKDAIDAQTLHFCQDTQDTLSADLDSAIAQLRVELTEGIIEDVNTLSVLTARVNGVFDGAEKWRARRIATTEASRAVHDGQVLAAAKSGMVIGFKFLLSPDACPICLTAESEHGETPIETALAQVGVYDRNLPPIHPFCRCSFTEILVEPTEGE